MDKVTLITVVSLALVLVVTGMIAFLVSNTKNTQKRRTMSIIRGGSVEDNGKGSSAKDNRRETLARKLKETDPDAEEKKKSIPVLLQQAGLTISVRKFWMLSLALSVVLTFAVFVWGKGPFVILMTAIIGLFGLPRYILKRMIKRRQKKFLADLPDVLEAMTRLLRAGMPVSESIKMVAREFTGPIGEEMGRIFDQQKIGVSLPEAVQECARRMPLPEVQMFATAVTIQAQTGSSLSEILEGLAKVIRARFRLRRKVQALSSEAKSSAAIIGALPVLVGLGLYFMNPEYIGVLFTEKIGKFLLAGAVFWMACGVFVMKQMINFKV
jgi:tight adherence protein B